jgi:hypoxanthine phosphoribosyltransferase
MDTIKIKNMNYDESILASTELSEKIRKTGFNPHRVIGIATGGIIPAKIVSKNLKIPLVLMRVSRPLTDVKKFARLNKLPKTMQVLLRKLEMTLGLYRFFKRRVISGINGDLPKERYVIVDDSLDTGKTVEAVIRYLNDSSQVLKKEILVATLTQIFDDAYPKADCKIYQNVNFSFPWSRDSDDYIKFEKFCIDYKIQI